MPDVRLLIDGTEFFGWQEVEVVRAVDALAGRFRLKLTQIDPDPVPRGSVVELYLEKKLIITGYIFGISVDVTDSRHTITVTGRDKTGDLVDADTLIPSQETNGLTLRELIEQIVAPFGITTIFESEPPERFKKFSFQQETAFDAIERACRMRGVFPSSDEFGNLVIRAYGATRSETGLTMGENVLSSSAGFDDTDRFSEYHVMGQQPGTDGVEPEEAAGPTGKAFDRGVDRYRPKIIIAEAAVDSGLAQQRAEWEATVRAAKAVTVSCVIQGWTHDSGELWRENQLVRTDLPQHKIDGDMLIKGITYSLNDSDGTTTTLDLVRPDAFKKQPDLEAEEIGRGDDDEDEELE